MVDNSKNKNLGTPNPIKKVQNPLESLENLCPRTLRLIFICIATEFKRAWRIQNDFMLSLPTIWVESKNILRIEGLNMRH